MENNVPITLLDKQIVYFCIVPYLQIVIRSFIVFCLSIYTVFKNIRIFYKLCINMNVLQR